MRPTRAIFFVAVCVSLVGAIVGCPSAPCARRGVGAPERCVEVVCPKGATIDDRSGTCACAEGSLVIAGACVPYALADAFCGKGATAVAGACVRKKCSPGEALDREHGLCLPESTVLATFAPHTPRAGDHEEPRDQPKQRASCLYGALLSHHGQLTCAMGALSCGRGEHFVKGSADAGVRVELAGSCEPDGACGAGESFDELVGRCERFVSSGNVVDVGTWARVVIGVDGAEGTNAFCAPIRENGPGRFQIQLTLADNDITRASAALTPRPGTLPTVADAAQHALQDLTNSLRFLGGTSSAATVSLAVVCNTAGSAPPSLEVKGDQDAGR